MLSKAGSPSVHGHTRLRARTPRTFSTRRYEFSRTIGAQAPVSRLRTASRLAVRQTLSFDGARVPAQVRDKIESLADRLRPIDLEQRGHAVVAGSSTAGLDFEDIEFDENEDPINAWERLEAIARALGKQVAEAGYLIECLAPDLVRGQGRTFSFGRGLAQGADPRRIWTALKDRLIAIPQAERRFDVFQGMLCELQDQDCELFEALLDEVMKDVVL